MVRYQYCTVSTYNRATKVRFKLCGTDKYWNYDNGTYLNNWSVEVRLTVSSSRKRVAMEVPMFLTCGDHLKKSQLFNLAIFSPQPGVPSSAP